ncbi:hypothetical protein B0F90DRAFT_1740393 [Multifurca ochricompacta]|uniref:BZIP domain-containing protein n=1 Tax=Multifurca ochricompacta TaxID=376703 RepID=A0AAD4M2E0_9AGAM|nr:hypothetical protein B0F90DRAFT_1740393 [Multifurca ochricompacta]
MSSKRGRKRNDNLPPNRARDVQRAFRARRAAHLDALEQRVAELEEENGNLRAALNLPPANRPPLGKGPTGKDKPKTPSAPPPRPSAPLDAVSHAGSSADSPTSTRAQSLSPSTITSTMRPSQNAVHSLEGSSWDQGIIMGEEQNHSAPHASSPSTGYPLPGVPPHTKPPSQYSYSSPAQSSSRTTLPGTMYMPTVPQGTQNFSHPTDRPLSEAYASGNYPVRDPRDDQQRFSYSQPSYSGPEAAHLSQHSPSTSLHYPQQQQRDPSPAQTPLPFAPRRSITDPQGFSSLVNQYPHLPPPPALRRLSPPRLAESSHSVRPSFNGGSS